MKKKLRKAHLIWILPAALVLAVGIGFLVYSAFYYHADGAALDALGSDDAVRVSQTEYGWFFDGPSEEAALVFYPGAKVEETAYAPLLHGLAAEGMDACLVKMPLRFAFLGIDRADAVMAAHDYARWYVGGHSLGGAMAAEYAARHGDAVGGVILLGAYTQASLDDDLLELVILGSEDGLVSPEELAKGREAATSRYVEREIPGGNHAQFGSYGVQSGDGTATIPPGEQQAQAIRAILEAVAEGE